MVIRFYENLLNALRERQRINSGRLCAGTFNTLEEYKLIVGKYKGLEEAEELVKRIYKEMFDSRVIREGKGEVEDE